MGERWGEKDVGRDGGKEEGVGGERGRKGGGGIEERDRERGRDRDKK